MKNEHYLPPIKKQHVGCPCCSSLGHSLPLDTVLCNGFGGWMVTRNGEVFLMEDSGKEWSEFKTLQFVENKAKRDTKADWKAICFMALHGETYQRQFGKWLLVEENEGFA